MYIPGTGIGFFMIWRFSVLYGIDFGAKAETCTIEIADIDQWKQEEHLLHMLTPKQYHVILAFPRSPNCSQLPLKSEFNDQIHK